MTSAEATEFKQFAILAFGWEPERFVAKFGQWVDPETRGAYRMWVATREHADWLKARAQNQASTGPSTT